VHTFLATLHVVAAVFIIGPVVAIPMTGLRSIRTGDVRVVKVAARMTMLYGFLSLIVFGLGAATVPTKPDEYSFRSAWVTISMTLYIVAVIIVLAWLAPSLSKAATLMEAGTAVDDGSRTRDLAEDATVTARAQDLQTKSKLDAVRGRVATSAGLAALLFVLITVLMVVKPFS
jgi:uncharacterized membrane protein